MLHLKTLTKPGTKIWGAYRLLPTGAFLPAAHLKNNYIQANKMK